MVIVVVTVTVDAVMVFDVMAVLVSVKDDVLVGRVVVTVVDGVVVDERDTVTVLPAERVIVNHIRVMVILVLVVDGVAVTTTVRVLGRVVVT